MVWASGSFGLKFENVSYFYAIFLKNAFKWTILLIEWVIVFFFCIRVLLNHKVVKNENRVSGSVFRKMARRNDAIPTKLLSVDYHNPKTLSFKIGNEIFNGLEMPSKNTGKINISLLFCPFA